MNHVLPVLRLPARIELPSYLNTPARRPDGEPLLPEERTVTLRKMKASRRRKGMRVQIDQDSDLQSGARTYSDSVYARGFAAKLKPGRAWVLRISLENPSSYSV